jgi:Lon protease-like protein
MMMVRLLVTEVVKPQKRFGVLQLVDGRWGVIDRESGGEVVEDTEQEWKIVAVGTAGRLNKAAREGRVTVAA